MSLSFATAGVVALPVVAETAAWVVPFEDELRILINRPGSETTAQLRVLPTRLIEQLPALPMIAAAGCRCGRLLLVTGADRDGRPLVVGVAEDGSINWQVFLRGETPIRWPISTCAPEAAIVWQTEHGKIEVAEVGAGGLVRSRAFSVGGPPLGVAAAGNSIWAVWPETSQIVISEVTKTNVRTVHVHGYSASDVAVGASPEGACVAWASDASAFLIRIAAGGESSQPPVELDLADAAGGTLAVFPGPEPLVWAQRLKLIEGEPPRWTSVLSIPGGTPLVIERQLHSVAWWGDTVVALGSSELRFLKLNR